MWTFHLSFVLHTTCTDAPAAMKTVMTSDSRSLNLPRAMLPPRVAALLTWVPVMHHRMATSAWSPAFKLLETDPHQVYASIKWLSAGLAYYMRDV